ncbi:MAG: LysM peptidoglycan-binding domain-containing protein [Cyclobacteriaceae bacterium]|nr:LysM peptidoglycan-binding domain-containing protein [Cyclobacteriaceae bacterium]
MIKVIFLTLSSFIHPAAPADSLRMETINGKRFIIHSIDEKETLYAISRRYGVSITSILEANPTADGGLSVGQQLKVPYVPKAKPVQTTTGDRKHKVAAGETLFSISRMYDVSVDELKAWNNLKDNALSPGQELIIKKKSTSPALVEIPTTKSLKGVHTVVAGETLYSISRQYNVSVQQLKEWNSLVANEVQIGQTLFLTQPMNGTPEVKPEVQIADAKPEVKEVVVSGQPEIKTQPEVKETTIRISEKVTGSDEVKEGGLAELIEGTDGNRKYLALHRTAKVGTILKVRNELNNREVFVRVAGSLPNIGINNNVIIKISKSAYDRLGAIDPKFRVEVTYYK